MAEVRCETDYERSDAPPRLLAVLAAGLALAIVVVLGAIAIAFPQALSPRPRGPLEPLPHAPRLQSDPAGDLAAYRYSEAKKLGTYGPAGERRVRVPVERAMNAVASQGWSDAK